MSRFSAAVANGRPGGEVADEFKTLVRECHRRGIEVILDVVFNHTAEGNEKGPTLSFRWALVGVEAVWRVVVVEAAGAVGAAWRLGLQVHRRRGRAAPYARPEPTPAHPLLLTHPLLHTTPHHTRGLDNRVYYMMAPGGEYYNYSGCGNTFNCNNPTARQFVIDCLRFWVTEYHIDGFRCAGGPGAQGLAGWLAGWLAVAALGLGAAQGPGLPAGAGEQARAAAAVPGTRPQPAIDRH
jgi:hypothetical protein